MGWLGDLLGGLPPVLVYLVVAALVTAETAFVAGVLLPSATALVALGLLANAGVVPVVPALLIATAAALLGGNLAYRSAASSAARAPASPSAEPRSPGTAAPSGRLASRWARSAAGRHGARAERLFVRHGGRAIFLGQWVVGARTLMPRLAGRNGVPYKRFALWHTPSATLWALWMVGASYLAGAGYNVLAARAGRAAGALAALTLIIVGLILAGRWLGQNPFPVRTMSRSAQRLAPFGFRRGPAFPGARAVRWHPVVAVALSLGLLTTLAVLLVEVIPPVVRFSGLAGVDESISGWTQSQWTSDGYLFAFGAVTTLSPEVLLALAVPIALLRWWWRRSRASLSGALGPVLPMLVLAAVMSTVATPSWRAAAELNFPPPAEFDGPIPLDAAATVLADMSAGATAQVAAAAGLLAWLLSGGLPWKWRVTVWTAAAVLVAVCAGSWIYLGWSRTSETAAAIVLGVSWAALNAAIWSARTLATPPAEPARELITAER